EAGQCAEDAAGSSAGGGASEGGPENTGGEHGPETGDHERSGGTEEATDEPAADEAGDSALRIFGTDGVGDHATLDDIGAADGEANFARFEAGLLEIVHGLLGLVAIIEDARDAGASWLAVADFHDPCPSLASCRTGPRQTAAGRGLTALRVDGLFGYAGGANTMPPTAIEQQCKKLSTSAPMVRVDRWVWVAMLITAAVVIPRSA